MHCMSEVGDPLQAPTLMQGKHMYATHEVLGKDWAAGQSCCALSWHKPGA
jgi:hypothetical protein